MAMLIEVDTSTATRGVPAPARIHLNGRRNIEVVDVIDQWVGARDQYFKVKDGSGNVYILRFDEPSSAWELVMFLSKQGAGLPDLLTRRATKRSPPAVDGGL